MWVVRLNGSQGNLQKFNESNPPWKPDGPAFTFWRRKGHDIFFTAAPGTRNPDLGIDQVNL